MDDFYQNKIPVSMSWIEHADGSIEPEVHLPIDDLIEFDGPIIEAVKDFKKKYVKFLKRGNKLKKVLVTGNSKKIWCVSKQMHDFNTDVENKFEIKNMYEAYSKDINISIRYIRNCLDFARLFSYYDVSKNVPFGYYQSLIDCARILQEKKLFKKEKRYLKIFSETGTLPPREKYRHRLKQIISDK